MFLFGRLSEEKSSKLHVRGGMGLNQQALPQKQQSQHDHAATAGPPA